MVMLKLKYPLLLLLLTLQCAALAQQADKLSENTFRVPPSTYGIRCWWWWLNGNTNKETITRDLEEMKAKGFSGACIFDAGGAEQRGNAQVPEGPMFGSPAWRELYMHAIAEADRLGLVMSLSIQSGWNLGGPDITPDEAAKQVTFSELKVAGGSMVHVSLPMPKIRDEYYRDIKVMAFPFKNLPDRKPVRDFENKSAMKEVGWSVPETRPLLTDIPATPGEEDAAAAGVLDLTQHFKNGKLEWKAPAGEWTVLRIGYTTTHSEVSTSSGKWQGRVIDYMSEKHFNRYWDTNVEPLLTMIGNKAGKTLKYLQTDSFEAGGMNWTDGFDKEFKKRRGYDLTPYLPVLTGKIIENREVSNRFLSDFRKTISDCISDHHYRLFAERARKHGMGIQPESAGPHAGPFDGLKNYSHSEIMMSEFWSPSPHRSKPVDRFFVKQAASAAKIFNKKLVCAESFTTIGPHWNDVIWADMKPSADHEFCAGLNLIYLHTFTSSPKEMGLPGQEYFAGTHFNPNVTWWNYSTGFIRYLTRCHYMLQHGTAVSDVLYYYGDHIPNIGRYKDDDPAKALPGYDYDLINEDKLLDLQFKNGLITLPHGVSYKVLALPDHKVLSYAALKKVEELVKAGATVIGNKPSSTVSLVGYPEKEQDFKKTAEALWGDTSDAMGEKATGKGRIVWGKTAYDVLFLSGLPVDFQVMEKKQDETFDYIHRADGDADWYFISSQNKEAKQIMAAFRMSGRQPELWNPVTGESMPAKAFTQSDGRTFIPLDFDPNGSVFVVFRKPIDVNVNGKSRSNDTHLTEAGLLRGTWKVNFDPKWGGPGEVAFPRLVSWTDRPEEGIKYYSGKAVYSITFNIANENPDFKTLFLDLGDVKDVGIARVKLNGRDVGTVWTPPFRVSVAGVLRRGNNDLEIEVVNTWRNRLVGDRGKPQEQRLTKTNIKILDTWQLLPSGLLGPVRLLRGDF